MPIIPSVFQPIRSNDYQQRPIKAYKRYRITSTGFNTSSGYFRHNGLYRKTTPHIFAATGEGVGSLSYPVNTETNTNQHVVWNTINHRYYKNHNPAHSADFLDISQQQRFIWHSASIFTAPYGQVGEKIKHGSFQITSSVGDTYTYLSDDSNGNLRDPIIEPANFASSSRNFFHMSFNKMYQQFDQYDRSSVGDAISGSAAPYLLNLVENTAMATNGVSITPGVNVDGPLACSHNNSNVILNGDMELDANWVEHGSGAAAHSSAQANGGTYSFSYTVTADNDGLRQTGVPLEGGRLYEIKWDIYVASGTLLHNQVIFQNTSFQTNDGEAYEAGNDAIAGQWVSSTIHARANPGATSGFIEFTPGAAWSSGTTTFYLDNVSVTPCDTTSGMAALLNDGQYIRIPHNDKFDRFGKCDDWTIAFWYCSKNGNVIPHKEIISKYGIKSEQYYDKIDRKRKSRDITVKRTTDLQHTKTPFLISNNRGDSNSGSFSFKSSNGGNELHISSSMFVTVDGEWNHIAVRNSASLCEMFIDGVSTNTTSGSIPDGITANASDVMIGNVNGKEFLGSDPGLQVAELRMYDYAVNSTGLSSLANRNYLSGSLYQTNVAGNVFYKNGQVVISSPMPKYHSGSGMFENTWDMTYRGTHMIYENECLIRVPKDIFNVTMNPSSTYRPATVGDPCGADQKNLVPGELRKHLFVSGTLKPYITTIGLYDNHARLLATGKLAQPIQKNQDADMNFIVRWDY